MVVVRILLSLFFIQISFFSNAQLDSAHWIPPMHARVHHGNVHYLYLSTPEINPFDVTIKTGDGKILGVRSISNSNSSIFEITGNLNNKPTLTEVDELGKAITGKGLILTAEKKFYANLKVFASPQATSLTCKGTFALGKIFRVGHLWSTYKGVSKSHFVGLIATEDNTKVNLENLPDDLTLENVTSIDDGKLSVTLNKGESFVVSAYSKPTGSNNYGLIGALINSNKDVVVSCGSWTGSASPTAGRDIGTDQIVPLKYIGQEYILVKGGGSDDSETPLVVAHEDNTKIFVNGNTNAIATIDAGEFFRIPPSNFDQVGLNMFIQTNKPVFVYQMMAGAIGDQTVGLNFVPPISCRTSKFVDVIPKIASIGSNVFQAIIFITAEDTAKVELNGVLIPDNEFSKIPGNNNYKTYRKKIGNQDIKVNSSGSIQMGIHAVSGIVGFGAYYAGFDSKDDDEISLSLSLNRPFCPDSIFASGVYDSIKWYHNDILINGQTSDTIRIFEEGVYKAVVSRTVCNDLLSISDTIEVDLSKIKIKALVTNELCDKKGQIEILEVLGGTPTYEFSIDGGITYQTNKIFTDLSARKYPIIIKDKNECKGDTALTIGVDSITIGLEAKVKNETCVEQGSIEIINVIGGKPEYLFSIDGGANYQTRRMFHPLPPGTYKVLVKDSIGCLGDSQYKVGKEDGISIDSLKTTHAICNKNLGSLKIFTSNNLADLEFSIDGINYQNNLEFHNLAAGKYTLFVRRLDGCTLELEFEILDSSPPKITNISTQICFDLGDLFVEAEGEYPPLLFSLDNQNYSAQASFKGLNPGTYYVFVKDRNGCLDSSSIKLIPKPKPAILPKQKSCGQKIDSLEIEFNNNENYLVSLDGINFQSSNIFYNVPLQQKYIFIKDKEGCIAKYDLFLHPITPLELKLNSINPSCGENDGKIFAQAMGGNGGIVYSLGTNQIGSDSVFHNLKIGTYTIKGIDSLGCTTFGTILLENDCEIFIPNTFTPDKDGLNDFFKIYSGKNYKIESIQIFNRWGEIVHAQKNTDINSFQWDGLNRNKKYKQDVYIYQCTILKEAGEKKKFMGHINVLR